MYEVPHIVIAPDADLPRVQLKNTINFKTSLQIANKQQCCCDTSVDNTRKDNKMLNNDVKRHIMVIKKTIGVQKPVRMWVLPVNSCRNCSPNSRSPSIFGPIDSKLYCVLT